MMRAKWIFHEARAMQAVMLQNFCVSLTLSLLSTFHEEFLHEEKKCWTYEYWTMDEALIFKINMN